MTDSPPPPVAADFEERRRQSLWERFEALELECRNGHRNIRKSTNELEAQADSLEREIRTLTATVERLATAPVEATKLRFSPQVLVVIFTATFTVAGTVIGAAAAVRSDMRNINTRMDATDKLADQRYAEIKAALERQEAQRRDDKAAAETRLKKYDNDELLRDMGLKGPKR